MGERRLVRLRGDGGERRLVRLSAAGVETPPVRPRAVGVQRALVSLRSAGGGVESSLLLLHLLEPLQCLSLSEQLHRLLAVPVEWPLILLEGMVLAHKVYLMLILVRHFHIC